MIRSLLSSAQRRLGGYRREVRGAAAAEFALVSALFVYMLGNVVDVGIYAYDKMQVANAGQSLAETILANCPSVYTPVIYACETSVNPEGPLTNAKITTAIQESSLGSAVTYDSIAEGYYCVDTTGSLVAANTMSSSSSAANCNTYVTGDVKTAGDYVHFTASASYTPLFGHLSVAGLLPRTISKAIWIRVA